MECQVPLPCLQELCHWNWLEPIESIPHSCILFIETPVIIPSVHVQTCVKPVYFVFFCSGRPQRMQQGLLCLSCHWIQTNRTVAFHQVLASLAQVPYPSLHNNGTNISNSSFLSPPKHSSISNTAAKVQSNTKWDACDLLIYELQ